MTLAQAPSPLRAAVRRTLGIANGPAGSVFQQTELAASDGAAGDLFGSSVAIYGSTAVVGAYRKNSAAGAAYVFVRSGSVWSQQEKLTASDPAAGDEFGVSVAIYGSTIVVGAAGKNSNTGAAYIFVNSGGAWSQQAKLTASDAGTGDWFGISAAVYGSTVVVGAFGNATPGAYVFVRSGTTWMQQAKLTEADYTGGDLFGDSVSISGSTVLVGADRNDAGNQPESGAAYVFVRSGTTWSQQAKLTPSDAAGGDFFGSAVAISGSTAVVSALGKNSFAGAAYVFSRSGSTWSQQAELTASDAAADDEFGDQVSVAGGLVVVGAYLAGATHTGAAYVFARSGTAWPQVVELTATDAAAADELGDSVSIYGSTALIGAFNKNSSTGAAYVFVLPSQQARLAAADGTGADSFGFPVAISGSIAVVGAYGKQFYKGAAYVFVRSGSTWSQQAELTAADGAGDDYFGWSVAISGTTVVVGAWSHDSLTGAAYVFVQSGSAWSQQAELTASDGGPNELFGYSVAIYGSTVLVGEAQGEAAYVFVGSGSSWSQQAKLTPADGATGDFFGDSVALAGSTAIIGAYNPTSNTGAAYVYIRSGTTWSQQAKLAASDEAAGDDFGYAVALSGSTAVIGAKGRNSGTGAAYVFVRSGTSWSQQAELAAADGVAGDEFGFSVAIAGSTILIGAPVKNSGAGSAYVFTPTGTVWTQQAELYAADAATNDYFGSSVTQSGTLAGIGAYGTNDNTGAAYIFSNA